MSGGIEGKLICKKDWFQDVDVSLDNEIENAEDTLEPLGVYKLRKALAKSDLV